MTVSFALSINFPTGKTAKVYVNFNMRTTDPGPIFQWT